MQGGFKTSIRPSIGEARVYDWATRDLKEKGLERPQHLNQGGCGDFITSRHDGKGVVQIVVTDVKTTNPESLRRQTADDLKGRVEGAGPRRDREPDNDLDEASSSRPSRTATSSCAAQRREDLVVAETRRNARCRVRRRGCRRSLTGWAGAVVVAVLGILLVGCGPLRFPTGRSGDGVGRTGLVATFDA